MFWLGQVVPRSTRTRSTRTHRSQLVPERQVSSCAFEVLRSHGKCDDALRDIFNTVVLGKLLYASTAWWGFAMTSSASKHSSVEVFGSVYMTRMILHLFNSPRTVTKVCSGESDTAIITACNSFYLMPTITVPSIRPQKVCSISMKFGM